MSIGSKVERIKNAIGNYPDFPKKGIVFRDLFPILQKPELFEDLIDVLCDHIKRNIPDVNGIVGLESRGFLIAPIIALKLKVPFLPIRKSGKLPGEVKKVDYSLEYGMDSLELQVNAFTNIKKVVIIDDLLATGGNVIIVS
ncbi:adenine phosphoribosyltransferase-like [Centruroides sculpturatus]|uniref:adenine phosphoribosyltransferase-like n=1 Tax=Centruroides sculpturatus TaxID=218467 RepID=UPI000C6D17B3|nr:adenine phosphoribosyltransferase-like [Centruroides sculpturatus]